MTQKQLLDKHPKLAEIAATGLFDDIANHMRRFCPFMGQATQNFDAAGIARHAGRLEGYGVATEILHSVFIPAAMVTPQKTTKNYSEPPNVVSDHQPTGGK